MTCPKEGDTPSIHDILSVIPSSTFILIVGKKTALNYDNSTLLLLFQSETGKGLANVLCMNCNETTWQNICYKIEKP